MDACSVWLEGTQEAARQGGLPTLHLGYTNRVKVCEGADCFICATSDTDLSRGEDAFTTDIDEQPQVSGQTVGPDDWLSATHRGMA